MGMSALDRREKVVDTKVRAVNELRVVKRYASY